MSGENTGIFIAQFSSSAPLGGLILLVYCIIRRRFAPTLEVRRSYAPEVSCGPISTTSWFYWMYEAWKLSNWDYYKYAGIDALIFDLFLRTCLKICLFSLPVALIVLIPVYATGEKGSNDTLSAISLTNVKDESYRLYFTAIMAYVFMFIMQYFFTQLYLKVAYIAREFEIGNEKECIKNLINIEWRNFNIRTIDDISDTLDRIMKDNNNNNNNNNGGDGGRDEAPPMSAMITIDKDEDNGDKSQNENDESNGDDTATNTNEDKLKDAGDQKENSEKGRSPDVEKGLIKKNGVGSSSFSSDGDSVKRQSVGGNVKRGDTVVYDRNSKYFEERSDLFRHSIMIGNLPPPFWDDPAEPDKKLKALFDAMYPNQVQNVTIARNVTELVAICNQIDKHEEVLEKVKDKPDATTREKCGICGSKVNAQEFHTAKRNDLIEKYKEMTTNNDALDLTPTAFITFKSLEVAAICSSTPIRFGSTELNISRCHLHRANDILWENLQHNNFRELNAARSSIGVSMTMMLLFWSIPSAAIQGLANLRSIFARADIDLEDYLPVGFLTWLEGFLSIVLLNMWLTIVPIIIKNMVSKEFQTSNGLFAISCMKKYYDCLIVMVLLVTAVSGTVLTNLDEFSKLNLNQVFTQFGSGLSSMSVYFTMFVMYKALVGLPSTLLRPAYWIVRWILKTETNEWVDNWNLWSHAMLVFAIVLCYCTMAPFIYVIGILYFTVYMVIFRYQTVTCTWQSHEYGSYSMFPAVFNRVMVAVYISILTLIVQMVLKTAIIPTLLLLPLFIIMNIFQSRINKHFSKDFNLTSLNGAKAYDDKMNNREFEQDAKVYYVAPVLRKNYE